MGEVIDMRDVSLPTIKSLIRQLVDNTHGTISKKGGVEYSQELTRFSLTQLGRISSLTSRLDSLKRVILITAP